MRAHNQRTILLLGGTSETAPLATKLAFAGYQVLVSTATDEPLQIGEHPAIQRRCGRLNCEQMVTLVEEMRIFSLVDATHPYASEVQKTARLVAKQTRRSYLRYQRQSLPNKSSEWIVAKNHDEAAQIACRSGAPVLLTTGSRHLAPYVKEATRRHVRLFARVLAHPESIKACEAAGLNENRRIFGRGPFSVEQNRAIIREHQIGTIVSKDSGEAGGVDEKWHAAKREGCQFIVVQRPEETPEQCFAGMDELVTALRQQSEHDDKPEVLSES
jgi:precorrin-6A/cobalt-precorrin-6A reductase